MASPPRAKRPSGLGRVVVYYGLLAVLLILAVRFVPSVRDVVAGTRLSELEGSLSGTFGQDAPPPVGEPIDAGPWSGAAVAALSMFGALAIMVPVTWVYMLTRRHRGYEESVVHTLLILPVAVTGIVMIVQNSVALAFSLAGIVAAVRFRTTLDDTKDAVYVFLAIGVGLASGVQALGIALTLSLVFNGVVLVLWRTHFGNIYADPNARAGALGVGDIAAGPASANTALQVGDPAVLEAASVSDLSEIADLAVRIERHISEERAKKKARRANSLFLIHCRTAEAAQAYVEPILEGVSVRWKLVEMGPGPEGHLLIYVARIEDPGAQGAVMDQLRSAPDDVVTAAELRSLKGLKRRT
jgi:hypothetical protein